MSSRLTLLAMPLLVVLLAGCPGRGTGPVSVSPERYRQTHSGLFEEVVGDIEEGTPTTKPVYRDRMGRLRVPGTLRVDELGNQFDLDLEHEDVDSISGLVLTLLGRPPRVGDTVRFDRLLIEVTAVKGHGVEQCAVSLLA